MDSTVMSRQAASDATGELGWRFVLGSLTTWVRVDGLAQAAGAAARAAEAAAGAGAHLRMDLRDDRLVLVLQSPAEVAVTARDATLAGLITAELAGLGLRTDPAVGGPDLRSVQLLEIAIDALDIAAVRPFWRAVLGYQDEPGAGPDGPLVDPVRQGPAVWFQQMDVPRPQRNRIHLDISVPHDQAERRVAAALAAGGRLVSDAAAPAFRVLADAEGNEACVSTWQGRD